MTLNAALLINLTIQAKRLNDLLADPHPGRFTWQEDLSRVLEEICSYAPKRESFNRVS